MNMFNNDQSFQLASNAHNTHHFDHTHRFFPGNSISHIHHNLNFILHSDYILRIPYRLGLSAHTYHHIIVKTFLFSINLPFRQ